MRLNAVVLFVSLFMCSRPMFAQPASIPTPGLIAPEIRLASVDMTTSDSLWQQANQAWSKGEAYKPGSMRIVSEELDRRGQVSSSTITVLALRYAGNDTITEVVSATKDGKDITAQTRADYAKRAASSGSQNDGPMNPDDLIPFTASARPDLRRGPGQTHNGLLVLPYEIVKKKSGSVGRLFFNASGWPVRMTYTLQPLPPLVSLFEGEVHFNQLDTNALVAGSMSFLAEGGILLIRKRFAIRMDFSDYRLVGSAQ